MIYLLRSSILLALLYGGFALMLSRETFHRLNRICLLLTLAASLVLPAIELRLDVPWASKLTGETTETGDIPGPPVAKYEMVVSPETENDKTAETEITSYGEEERTSAPDLQPAAARLCDGGMKILRLIYLLGFILSLGLIAHGVLQLVCEVRSGIRTRDEEGNTIVILGGDFAPHSFLHYIIISARDWDKLREPILRHEQAHVRYRHSWDILLCSAVQSIQWFNPFVYLLGRDLRTVHEYEADAAVLRQGIDATRYQLLLVTKAVGNRLQTLANSLSHGSLKKRITMMHKENSRGWQMAKGAILPMLMAAALVGWAKAPLPYQTAEGSENENAAGSVERLPGDTLKAVSAWFVRKNEKNPRRRSLGDCFIVAWTKGTWVENASGDSFVEDRPVCEYPWGVMASTTTVRLDGKELDIHNLPDIPARMVRHVKRRQQYGHEYIDLSTGDVKVPQGIKGSINPELTVLLTGIVPEGAYQPVTVWVTDGLKDSYDWKQYTHISWTEKCWNITDRLRDVALRKDHRVRINVTRQGERHVERMTKILHDTGITNYEFVRQG